jgi:hypothetical protein
MLGWWPLRRQRTSTLAVRLACIAMGFGLLALSLLVLGEIAVHLVSARSLNATSTLALPRWLDELTERREIAYPAHAAIGTVLETLDLSPAATGVQWLKAAAHAASDRELSWAAEGIAAALARDHDDVAMQVLCTVRDIGNARQQQAAQRSGLTCDRWTPSVALAATVSADHATGGSAISITAQVTSVNDVVGLVDVEVHDAEGKRIAQWVFAQEHLRAGEPRRYVVTWEIPMDLPPGQYDVKLGLFEPGWRALHGWRNAAASVVIAE